jgi:hypothetical protein
MLFLLIVWSRCYSLLQQLAMSMLQQMQQPSATVLVVVAKFSAADVVRSYSCNSY